MLWFSFLLRIDDDIDDILSRLERTSPTLVVVLKSAFEEVKNVIQLAHAAGVSRQIFFRPLMVGSHHVHFKDGVLVEVVKRDKPTDVLAAGGRYALLSDFFDASNHWSLDMTLSFPSSRLSSNPNHLSPRWAFRYQSRKLRPP